MLLIGVNRSPYTRRVAITLAAHGVVYEQRCLSGFGNREEVRRHNPLGRIPALVLDDGETLVDSSAIVDFFDTSSPIMATTRTGHRSVRRWSRPTRRSART